MIEPTCKYCDDIVDSFEMCGMHYMRWRRTGDPLLSRRPFTRKCSEPGCDESHRGRGFCGEHTWRLEVTDVTMTAREHRFWAQVSKGAPDECWPWTGYVAPNGYGQYGAGDERLAHRNAYEYAVGPIPAGLVLDHLCHTADPQCADTDNCLHRRCCNPKHLEPVTAGENVARGRGGDSWGYVPDPIPAKPKAEKPTVCTECGNTEKPIYKSGKCRPCYRRWLKDPKVERPSKRTREQRFWLKVDKNGPVPEHKPELGQCWVWTAGINRSTGYGRFGVRHGEMMDAHRFSYLLERGSIPEKHDVHHLCHLRHCVRPDHLEALTRSQNLAERKNRRTA